MPDAQCARCALAHAREEIARLREALHEINEIHKHKVWMLDTHVTSWQQKHAAALAETAK